MNIGQLTAEVRRQLGNILELPLDTSLVDCIIKSAIAKATKTLQEANDILDDQLGRAAHASEQGADRLEAKRLFTAIVEIRDHVKGNGERSPSLFCVEEMCDAALSQRPTPATGSEGLSEEQWESVRETERRIAKSELRIVSTIPDSDMDGCGYNREVVIEATKQGIEVDEYIIIPWDWVRTGFQRFCSEPHGKSRLTDSVEH